MRESEGSLVLLVADFFVVEVLFESRMRESRCCKSLILIERCRFCLESRSGMISSQEGCYFSTFLSVSLLLLYDPLLHS